VKLAIRRFFSSYHRLHLLRAPAPPSPPLKPPSSDLATPSAETGLKTSPAPVELPEENRPSQLSMSLAERYASPAIKDIWFDPGTHPARAGFLDRGDEAQKDLGVPIPGEASRITNASKNVINLESILKREQVTLHGRQGASGRVFRSWRAASSSTLG